MDLGIFACKLTSFAKVELPSVVHQQARALRGRRHDERHGGEDEDEPHLINSFVEKKARERALLIF